MALIGGLFGAWGRSEPAALVIDLPSKRLRVLRRSESEVKSIKKKIMEAKKANATSKT